MKLRVWSRWSFRFLDSLLGGLGALVLLSMLVLVMSAVAVGQIASSAIVGSDEAAVWLFVALVFVGLPSVSDNALAMRLDILSGHMGAVGQSLCKIISDAVVVNASLALLSGGITVIALMGGSSPVLGVPEWLRFAPVVAGSALSIAMVWLRCGMDGRWIAGTSALVLGSAVWTASHVLSFEPVAMPSLVAGVIAFVLLLIGAPLPHALICGLSLAIPFGAQLPEAAIVQNTVAGIGKIMLLAIPFFLLAGVLMNLGGLAGRLVRLASSLVGHFRGGLAQTTLVTNVMFAGISGSSIADAAFGAKVFTPALVKHGYRPERAAAIVAATSVLPNIIPPSIAFLMLASVTNLSVGALFFGGLLAGLLLAAFLAVALWMMSASIASRQDRADAGERLLALKQSVPAIGLALIVLICIRFGVMTTTEAAGLAALYSLCVVLIVGGCGITSAAMAFVQSARETAAVGLLIGASAPFVFLLAVDDLPSVVQGIFAAFDSPWLVLLAANAILLAAGCFLDIGAAILLLAPLLMPVAVAAGIDPIDFGAILIVNLMIGGLTPPVGILVYVSSRLSGLPAGRVFLSVLPLVAALLAGLTVISVFASFRAGAFFSL